MDMARIQLAGDGGVDLVALQDICEQADLPPGDICLIVGDPLLESRFQAVTVSRSFAPSADNLCGLEEHLDKPWDAGISVGVTWARRQPEFPAYFAYLLGHELGHATTILSRPRLAVFEDLVTRYLCLASESKDWTAHQLPHEARYDQFGLAVAEHIFGWPRVAADIQNIIAQNLSEDVPRLLWLLEAQRTRDFTGLDKELAAFAEPYRDSFLQIWLGARQTGQLRIADGVEDLGELWAG